MALVDCTILVDPSQVAVSLAAAPTVQVTPVTANIVVEGLVGIRGPAGESSSPGDFFKIDRLLSELETEEMQASARVNLGVQDNETEIDFTLFYQLSK